LVEVSILHRRFFDARAARGRDPARAAAALPDRSAVLGHSLDSSHQRMPCRICSDFDNPVRAVID
jgi:hypothetical protein